MNNEHISNQSPTHNIADTHSASVNSTDLVPVLVAQVYEEASPAVRGRLLEQLLQPLSLLSLTAVANGIFAKMTLGNGWSRLQVNVEDASRVDSSDVVALVSHVQQVSIQAVDGLTRIIANVPVLAGSAAAAMLITVLTKRAMSRPPINNSDIDLLG